MTNLIDLVGSIAKQAINNNSQQNSSTSQSAGSDSLLSSVLGHLLGGKQQSTPSNSSGLDSILGSVLGQMLGSKQNQTDFKSTLLIAVLPLVLSWIQQQGGLQGALNKLSHAGLSNQVNSWVDVNSQNENTSMNQIQSLFNDDEIHQAAQKNQCSTQDIYSAIAYILPQVIHSLTPNGTQTNMTEADQTIQHVIQMINQFTHQ